MLENIHQQSMSITQHLHTWLLIGQHVKSSGCFLVRRDYIWFCPHRLFEQMNNYQTAALYLPHHKPLKWRRTILIWAHWIYSVSPGDILESILVTVKCLSFFHQVFSLWISSLMVSCFHPMPEMKGGCRQRAQERSKDNFKPLSARGQSSCVPSGENHMPWE